ncbi:hypothetical protein M404DRAFT_1005299 [Pisolithus tinctorius Marx 270]|uniref:Uncharacterized protein n=1 Tax=Pisolithus tinctorius Marx 270 TaxID=870435 RepID=A0A0C3NTR1_PISTI|nr:hypothetical protein M404DRAFT_1005299 [Pisolithus tinctorius Marx 270]
MPRQMCRCRQNKEIDRCKTAKALIRRSRTERLEGSVVVEAPFFGCATDTRRH